MNNSARFTALAMMVMALSSISLLTPTGAAGTTRSNRMMEARQRVDTIAVPDMQCGMCEERITEALHQVKGVRSVVVDLERKLVVVTVDANQVKRTALEQRIAAVGYNAGNAHATDATKKALPMCCRAN